MVSPVLMASHGEGDPEAGRAARMAAAVQEFGSWGWTVVTDENRVLVLGDNRVSAVEIDRGLGGEVQHYLAVRLLGGPVVELPGTPTRWLFLASGFAEARTDTFVRIRARGGLIHGAGTFIPLPPSRLPSGDIVWRQPATGRAPTLPPFSAIAGALRAVTEGVGLS